MRRAAVILGTLAAAIVLVIAVYRFGLTYDYRYRLSLEVEVDGQIKSGSSVIQVTRQFDPVPGMAWPHYSTTAIGQAVFVDLGPRGNLFVLLTNEGDKSPEVLAARVFHFDPIDQIDNAEQRRRATKLTAERAHAQLTPERLPILVTFSDLTDPKTARVVQPNEFEATIGPGVRFKAAWIEMTEAPVTTGIYKILPWLRSHKGYLAGPEVDLTNSRPSRNLTGNEFVKGLLEAGE